MTRRPTQEVTAGRRRTRAEVARQRGGGSRRQPPDPATAVAVAVVVEAATGEVASGGVAQFAVDFWMGMMAVEDVVKWPHTMAYSGGGGGRRGGGRRDAWRVAG